MVSGAVAGAGSATNGGTTLPSARERMIQSVSVGVFVVTGERLLKDVYHIHRQSHFLFGRNRTVVHVPVDHPSSSSQHAVIQYRFINGVVKPYLIDIESTNGTWLNNKKLETQ